MDSFGKRLKRYTQVSTALGGMAAHMAGERLGFTSSAAPQITSLLGSLKGPLMKVAQILSTVPDMLPPGYAEELSSLQAHAPPMGVPFVRRRMAAELGPQWRGCFSSFEEQSLRAASLGQVHQAISLEGDLLACKLQYPDMSSALSADLSQLRLLLGLYERYSKGIDTEEIIQEITDRLWEELDYKREARNIGYFRIMLQGLAFVPQVYEKLSTDRLLTLTWLEGQPLKDFKEAPLESRNLIAENLFKTWYTPFYRYGLIHGDPHFGNYTITPQGQINLLDFGCIRVFPAAFVEGVILLYEALMKKDEEQAAYAYETWGFKNLSREMMDVLNLWAKFLYTPLMDDRVRPLSEHHSGIYGKEVAHKVHQELKRLGGIRPPREFVFMDRAAVGLGSAFIHLKAELNWYQIFQTLIQDFKKEDVQHRQDLLLKE